VEALDFFQFRRKEACGEGRMWEGGEAERGLPHNSIELEVNVIR